jgi:hypothetical protein
MRKIIFLDVDGVLNSGAFFRNQTVTSKLCGTFPECDIDKECVQRVQTIVKETGAEVVISSTWRHNYYDFLLGFLGSYNIPVIGKTKKGCVDCLRGNVILAWLQEHQDIVEVPYFKYKNYVILDDNSDMLLWQLDNFIQTSAEIGLSDENVEKAVTILNHSPSEEALVENRKD